MFLCLFLLLKCLFVCLFVCLWFCCIHGSQQFHEFQVFLLGTQFWFSMREQIVVPSTDYWLFKSWLPLKKSHLHSPHPSHYPPCPPLFTLYKLINHISQSISQNHLSSYPNALTYMLHSSTKWIQEKLQLFHSFLVDAKLFSVADRGNIICPWPVCLHNLPWKSKTKDI